MKKLICVVLSILILSCSALTFADANSTSSNQAGACLLSTEPTALESNASVYPTPDSDPVMVTYEFTANPETGMSSYTLTVGGSTISVTDRAISLAEKLYAMHLDGSDTPYFLVGDYGPSDDYVTYVYAYQHGKLYDCGMIDALPDTLSYHDDGAIHTRVRANVIETWYRPAQYVMAHTSAQMTDAEPVFRVAEVPQYAYPMGRIATLNCDITLQVSPTDAEPALTLPAG